MRNYILKCIKCEKENTLQTSLGICAYCEYDFEHPSLLEVEYTNKPDISFLEKKLDQKSISQGMWFYADLLPQDDSREYCTLGEGFTPLTLGHSIRKNVGLQNLWLKNETINPTGSFKDRSASLSAYIASNSKAKGVTIVSSGNMGSSVASYAAKCQIPSLVIVSPNALPSRIEQLKAFGAEVKVVEGQDLEKLNYAVQISKERGYHHLSSPFYPFGCEGNKTIAYEIIQQLDEVPDYVITPVGYGSLLVGLYRGLMDMHAVGYLHRLPALVGVQSQESPSLVKAYQRGLKQAIPDREDSICNGINQEVTFDSFRSLKAIYDTGGIACSVPDAEILKMQYLLAKKEGILAEPTGCAALAGLKKLLDQKVISPLSLVVVLITGGGLGEKSILFNK